MFFICIGPNGWAKADTIAAAIAKARGYCSHMREYLVWECAGPRDDYRVSEFDGTLEWKTGAPQPVRVRRRYRDGRMDRSRMTIPELKAAQAA